MRKLHGDTDYHGTKGTDYITKGTGEGSYLRSRAKKIAKYLPDSAYNDNVRLVLNTLRNKVRYHGCKFAYARLQDGTKCSWRNMAAVNRDLIGWIRWYTGQKMSYFEIIVRQSYFLLYNSVIDDIDYDYNLFLERFHKLQLIVPDDGLQFKTDMIVMLKRMSL